MEDKTHSADPVARNPNDPFACPKHRRNDARCGACQRAWETATYLCTQCAPVTEVLEIDRHRHNAWAEANGLH